MTREELKILLDAHTDSDFVDETLARRPWIFDTDAAYETWRQLVATELAVERQSIRIVGSGATGFSLSPLKPGRAFRMVSSSNASSSDIDVALIYPALFEEAWNTILMFDRQRRLGGTESSRSKTRLDVYWGLVGQYSLPQNTNPARQILTAISVARRQPPLRGYPVRCRVYKGRLLTADSKLVPKSRVRYGRF